jgi:hypothetical protein
VLVRLALEARQHFDEFYEAVVRDLSAQFIDRYPSGRHDVM